MNLVQAITTDNLVYIETYRAAKNIRRGLIRAYKNTIFRLSPIERENEKNGLIAARAGAPLDLVIKMKLAIIDEVERG